jgi:hypothetical protein
LQEEVHSCYSGAGVFLFAITVAHIALAAAPRK